MLKKIRHYEDSLSSHAANDTEDDDDKYDDDADESDLADQDVLESTLSPKPAPQTRASSRRDDSSPRVSYQTPQKRPRDSSGDVFMSSGRSGRVSGHQPDQYASYAQYGYKYPVPGSSQVPPLRSVPPYPSNQFSRPLFYSSAACLRRSLNSSEPAGPDCMGELLRRAVDETLEDGLSRGQTSDSYSQKDFEEFISVRRSRAIMLRAQAYQAYCDASKLDDLADLAAEKVARCFPAPLPPAQFYRGADI